MPVSSAAARLVELLDGERTVGEAITGLVEGLEPDAGQRLAAAAAGVLQTLYSDGVFEELPTAASPR